MVTRLAPDVARELVRVWAAAPGHGAACEVYRPGRYDVQLGEPRCARCGVPATVHRAYRALAQGGMHGAA